MNHANLFSDIVSPYFFVWHSYSKTHLHPARKAPFSPVLLNWADCPKHDESSSMGHKQCQSEKSGSCSWPGHESLLATRDGQQCPQGQHGPCPVGNEAQLTASFPYPAKICRRFAKSKQKAPNVAVCQDEKWAFLNSQQIRPCLSKPKLLDLTSCHTAELLLPFSQL